MLSNTSIPAVTPIWRLALCLSVFAAGPLPAQEAPANWLETRIAIEDLTDAGDHAGALALGDRLLEQLRAEFGDEDLRLAEAHLLLARAHRASGDFRAAEEEILAAIDVYEANVGRLSPELIEPFLALGDNYNEAGDFGAAISAWGEARTIGRRNYGLLNTDQLPIIDQMTAASEELDEIEAAHDLQQEALVLVERIHGPASPEAMEARFKYAAWLRDYSQYLAEELRIYYEIERSIVEYYERDPVLIARVMRERALSFRLANNADPLGLNGLRDALELLERMPEPPPRALAELLIDIGDWHVEFARTSGSEYQRAWALLGEVENGAELRRQWFSDLNIIQLTPLSRRVVSDDPDDPAGHLTIAFTVDVQGSTRDVRIIEAEPQELIDSDLADSAQLRFRDAKFRPSIANGELVTTNRIYRIDFRYVPPAAEAERK